MTIGGRRPALLTALALLLALLVAPPAPVVAQETPDRPNLQLDAQERPVGRATPGDALGLVGPGVEVTARLEVPQLVADPSPSELLAWRSAQALDGEVVTGEADEIRRLAASFPGVKVTRVAMLQELAVSEGNAVIEAAEWQSAGLGGQGIKVAVVDGSFDGYQALLGTELPANPTVKSFRPDGQMESGSEHGTGVAEIVYDLAPAATTYLVAADRVENLGPVVDYLIAEGIDVVNMSLGSTVGPLGSQSAATAAVQRAVAAGIVWVNAAGNSGDRHWGGNYVDTDADGWAEIVGTAEINRFWIPPQGTVFIDLSWADSATDLDLCLYEFFGATPVEVGCSETLQGPGIPPTEFVAWFNDFFFLDIEYGYAVLNYSGPPVHYDVFLDGDFYDLEFAKAEGSVLTPGDAPSAITVGASSWMTPYDVVEYSSRGPTVDGHIKPDLIAPTNVSTVAFGPGNFAGTSSASPHVAGLAALYLESNPGASPAEVKQALADRSMSLGYGNRPNNIEGWGLAQTGSVPQGDPATWSAQLVGDFDGDGLDDFAAFSEESGIWWVNRSIGTEFNPERWATFSTKTGWDPQLVGDFTGDGKDDVVSYHEGSGTWWVNRSTGSSFTLQKWATFSTRSGWDPQLVGDFTGDGKDDVVSYHEGSGTWWVNKSTGSSFTLQKWATFSTKTGWNPQVVGDFTGDDQDDVLNHHGSGETWYVNESTGSSFILSRWHP